MTDEQNDRKKQNSAPVLSTKEKCINAIPLVLVALTLAYFAYSCNQNRKTVQMTTDFVQQYNQTSSAFDQELDKCLHKNMPVPDFRQRLTDIHLPSLNRLQTMAATLPEESSAYVIAYSQIVRVLELKIQLAKLIVENKDTGNPQLLLDILQEINQLQKQIHQETEKHQK